MIYNSSNFSYKKTLKIFANNNNTVYTDNYFLERPNSPTSGVNFNATYTTSAGSPSFTFTGYLYAINNTTGNMVALTNPTVTVVGTSISVDGQYTNDDLSGYAKTLIYIWYLTSQQNTSFEVSFTTNPTLTSY
jgi:hypothetical protein